MLKWIPPAEGKLLIALFIPLYRSTLPKVDEEAMFSNIFSNLILDKSEVRSVRESKPPKEEIPFKTSQILFSSTSIKSFLLFLYCTKDSLNTVVASSLLKVFKSAPLSAKYSKEVLSKELIILL